MARSASAPFPPLRAAVQIPRLPLAVWCVLAVGLFGVFDLLADPHRLQGAFGDSDDATRLIQVRELLAGAPWYDTTLSRIGAPDALHSHWSRIVDAPIALLVTVASFAMSAADAELFARFVWPLVVLFALTLILAREAEAHAGRAAGLAAIGLMVTCLSATVQFAPGRIDHHNVQIFAAIGGSLLLARSFRDARVGLWAGALLGFGTATGLEALPLTATALACATLAAAAGLVAREGPVQAAGAYAASLVGLLALTVAPGRLWDMPCDTLSLNLTLGVAAGALGLAAALDARWPFGLWVRLALIAGAGVAALGLYTGLNPACLAGPFSEVDPALEARWLGNVNETRSLLWLMREKPLAAAMFAVFAAFGLAAAVAAVRTRRDAGDGLVLALLVAAVGLALWQVKFMAYASVSSVFTIAVAIGRLAPGGVVSLGIKRLLAFALTNQLAIATVVIGLLTALNVETGNSRAETERARCFAAASLAPLAGLAKGRAFNERDLGPFLVAATPLHAVSAPYHRLGPAIIATERLFAGDAAAAEAALRALGADYVVTCPALVTASSGLAAPPRSLRRRLLDGDAPAFLSPVALPSETPLRVWRLNPRP